MYLFEDKPFHLCFSGAMMKHYRVTATTSGFVIELDTAVSPTERDVQLFMFTKSVYLCKFIVFYSRLSISA